MMLNSTTRKLFLGFLLGCFSFYILLNMFCKNNYKFYSKDQPFNLYCPNIFYLYIQNKFVSNIYPNKVSLYSIYHPQNFNHRDHVIVSNSSYEHNHIMETLMNISIIDASQSYTFKGNISYSLQKNCHNLPKPFQFQGKDVLILIHIQKTGGTYFENKLTQYSILDVPCSCYRKKKTVCSCPKQGIINTQINSYENSKIHQDASADKYLKDSNEYIEEHENIDSNQFRNKYIPMWLFARSTYSWKACGLHADYTALKECVPKIIQSDMPNSQYNFRFATILREPISRYVSEYFHVKRGATWKKSLHTCSGQNHKLPVCYNDTDAHLQGSDWSYASIKDFLNCPYNLAHNRQTRHLADLTKIGCYRHLFKNSSESALHPAISERMLVSAKDNLKNGLAFFGLLEFQRETQYLLEKMLGIRLSLPLKTSPVSRSDHFKPSSEVLDNIKRVNNLDIRLYQYAKEIFFARLAYYRHLDTTGNHSSSSCFP